MTGPKSSAPHGTVSAYQRHLRHGDEPCEACRKATAEYHRRRYTSKSVAVALLTEERDYLRQLCIATHEAITALDLAWLYREPREVAAAQFILAIQETFKYYHPADYTPTLAEQRRKISAPFTHTVIGDLDALPARPLPYHHLTD